MTDAGGFLDAPLYITRSTGQVAIGGGGLTIAGPTNTNTLVVNDPANSPASMQLINTNTNGANLRMLGNGSTTPSKTLRAINGGLQIINDAYTASILNISDTGVASVPGGLLSSSWVDATTFDGANFGVRIRAGAAGNAILQFTNAGGTAELAHIMATPDGTTLSTASSLVAPRFAISNAAGQSRPVYWQTGGSTRWQIQVDGSPESGGNAGSNMYIQTYGDAGSIIGAPLTIARNSSLCSFQVPISNGSDVRLKKAIEPVTRALNMVERMNGVFFEYADMPGWEGKRQVGLIAQDVMDVLPEVVSEGADPDKTLGIAYSPIIAVLIEAIKELSEKVRLLEDGKPPVSKTGSRH